MHGRQSQLQTTRKRKKERNGAPALARRPWALAPLPAGNVLCRGQVTGLVGAGCHVSYRKLFLGAIRSHPITFNTAGWPWPLQLAGWSRQPCRGPWWWHMPPCASSLAVHLLCWPWMLLAACAQHSLVRITAGCRVSLLGACCIASMPNHERETPSVPDLWLLLCSCA